MIEQTADNKKLEQFLDCSISQLQKMIGLLNELNLYLAGQSAELIEQFNESFSDLQEKIKQTDLQLLEILQYGDIPEQSRLSLAKRKSLQAQIVVLLQESSMPRARSVRSLLANEMQSVKTGRRALSGYKKSQGRQGAIINRVK